MLSLKFVKGRVMIRSLKSNDHVSLEDYIMMIGKKTAALLEMCCTIGALIADADEKVVKALASYGLNLGIGVPDSG